MGVESRVKDKDSKRRIKVEESLKEDMRINEKIVFLVKELITLKIRCGCRLVV